LLDWAETANTYTPSRTPFHPTPEEKEKLKGLGYIQQEKCWAIQLVILEVTIDHEMYHPACYFM
jgi:hypothetical protein